MTLNHGGYLSSPIPDWLHQVIKLGTYPTTRGPDGGGTALINSKGEQPRPVSPLLKGLISWLQLNSPSH